MAKSSFSLILRVVHDPHNEYSCAFWQHSILWFLFRDRQTNSRISWDFGVLYAAITLVSCAFGSLLFLLVPCSSLGSLQFPAVPSGPCVSALTIERFFLFLLSCLHSTKLQWALECVQPFYNHQLCLGHQGHGGSSGQVTTISSVPCLLHAIPSGDWKRRGNNGMQAMLQENHRLP